MGCRTSLLADVAAEWQEVSTAWSGFLESCCVMDEAEFTPVQVLESAFAAYMEHLYPGSGAGKHCHMKSWSWLDGLVNGTPGLEFSAGWVRVSRLLDTRLVMGIKIARIRPKAVV